MTKPSLEDALNFRGKIKLRFRGDDDSVYKSFIEIMNMFKKNTKTVAEVYQEISTLFREHPDLLEDFKNFLPKSFAAAPTPGQRAPPSTVVEVEEAINFVDKVKLRFQGDDHHVYKSFLDILNMHRKENKTSNEVYKEVAALFREHPDLVEDFRNFLPHTSAAATPGQPAPPS